MPELPEVETVCKGLEPKLIGKTISGVKINLAKMVKGNSRAFAQALTGARVESIGRKGKIILINLGRAGHIGVHLKMTGQFYFEPPSVEPQKHTHIILDLVDADYQVRYRDTRQFGWWQHIPENGLETWKPWAELGPDALTVEWEEFRRRFEKRKGRLKSLLLNQAFIAGLGNIYVDEVLFKARLHPLSSALTVSPAKQRELFRAINHILTEAIACGGSSISDFQSADGVLGYFQTRHQVYGHAGEPCPRCERPIKHLVVGGRTSFFCGSCQPLRKAVPGSRLKPVPSK